MSFETLVTNAAEPLLNYKFPYGLLYENLGEELAIEYTKLQQAYTRLVNDYIALLSKSARLEVENEFMLKMVNNQDDGK